MKFRLSTLIPVILLIYLGVMSYIGFPEFENGNYLYYFGVIGITLVIIVILHFYLKRREELRRNRQSQRDTKR